MTDVTYSFGICQGQPCKRNDHMITSEDDKVTIRDKNYHKGCEPTPEELEIQNRSY